PRRRSATLLRARSEGANGDRDPWARTVDSPAPQRRPDGDRPTAECLLEQELSVRSAVPLRPRGGNGRVEPPPGGIRHVQGCGEGVGSIPEEERWRNIQSRLVWTLY